MSDASLLLASGITKSYAGTRALGGVTFELRAGEIHALIGENGAGKSTLIKIITGAVAPDNGTIDIDGQRVETFSPALAMDRGVAAIYQQPALFPELTVAENLAMGKERSLLRRVDWPARRSRARELLGRVGARIDPEREAGDLSMPEQQLVEIARAVDAGARIVVLDEPTASLSEEEVGHLFDVVREMRAGGAGVIYVSHRLEELPLIADRVTVLRDGSEVATLPMAGTTRDELVRLMVGRELSDVYPKRRGGPGEPMLEVRELGCASSALRDVSLVVRAGEVVGLAGLVGAGRTALARAIFGLDPAGSGSVLLAGKETVITCVRDAIRAGIAYVPEDRRRDGVILPLPISANVTLASLDRLSRATLLDRARERDLTLDYVRRLDIKTPATFAPAATLSGGNQQKVALARWLATNPSVLILDEPTQGVDVGAKAEIHALINQLADRGVAILMISSELPEILGMSDRIVVMREGMVAGSLDRADASQEAVLSLALGHTTVARVSDE